MQVIAATHTLVTTGITGTLQAGDLLIACLSSRIASTTPVTLPTGGEWTVVAQQNNNNILATTSGQPSALMAYCIRGASNPNFTFTHPTAPSVALGRLVAYRNVDTSAPLDTQTSFTCPAVTSAVSGTGLTTTQDDDLIVAMAAGGQEAAWTAFNATNPAGASSTASQTGAPTTIWQERADSVTTAGADTSLGIFDAIKTTTGATGNLTATASVQGGHAVVAGAFKIVPAAAGGVTLTADKGDAVLAGVATGVRAARRLTAATGAVAVTGIATGLRKGYPLAISTGAVAVTGSATNLIPRHVYTLPIIKGAVVVNFIDANLGAVGSTKTLIADPGAIALSLKAAALRHVSALPVVTDAIAVAGPAVTLRYGHALIAATGPVVLSGKAATLRHATIMPAVKGTVTLTGTATALNYSRKLTMTAAQGAVALTGQPVGLAPSSAPDVLFAFEGAIAASMKAASLRAAYVLKALPSSQTGDFIDDNGASNFIDDLGVTSWIDDNGLVLGGFAGPVTLAGQAVALRYSIAAVLPVASGVVTLAGQAAALRYGHALIAAKGAVSVTFNDATFRLRRIYAMIAAPGGIVLTGIPAALSSANNKQMIAAKGDIVLSGKAAALLIARRLPATSGPTVVTGPAADLVAEFRIHYTLGVAPGDIILTGQQANLLAPYPTEKQPGPLVFGRRLVVIPGRW